jgi:hypothetical protein
LENFLFFQLTQISVVDLFFPEAPECALLQTAKNDISQDQINDLLTNSAFKLFPQDSENIFVHCEIKDAAGQPNSKPIFSLLRQLIRMLRQQLPKEGANDLHRMELFHKYLVVDDHMLASLVISIVIVWLLVRLNARETHLISVCYWPTDYYCSYYCYYCCVFLGALFLF